jgi:hypothetical protein
MITDDAVAGYLIHQQSLSCEKTGEFSLGVPIWGFGIPVRCRCWAYTLLSQLADGMTYYSCHDFSWGGLPIRLTLCGPRGIRTLDLLNAIETRSQLRYGPVTVISF